MRCIRIIIKNHGMSFLNCTCLALVHALWAIPLKLVCQCDARGKCDDIL